MDKQFCFAPNSNNDFADDMGDWRIYLRGEKLSEVRDEPNFGGGGEVLPKSAFSLLIVENSTKDRVPTAGGQSSAEQGQICQIKEK